MQKVLFILCIFLFFSNKNTAQNNNNLELIPNPAFQVSGNQIKFDELIAKIGLQNIMLASAKKMESLKERIQKITTVDFRVINGWKLWNNINEERNSKTNTGKINMVEFNALLNLSKPNFLGTDLIQRLEKDKRYQIIFQFQINPTINTLPKEDLPSIGFCFAPNSPEEESKVFIPQKDFDFKPDANYTKYEKRKKIINNRNNDDGLQFNNKEWKDFLGITEKKYDEIIFEYTAIGDEKYLMIGNFWAENNSEMPSIDIVLKKISVKLVPSYQTK
ncbi:MAG: hypothetical protein EAZ06_06045 [Cytophagales bacterium]|nr:MAG: hypothetical protein EAY69_07760 [Cytophagales bacterium]TAH29640.1 MAG: hypothetical protein EAZ06_06045 [Cytophagales bacterium]